MRPLVIAAFISCCCAAFTPPLAIRPRPPVPLRSPRLRGCAESPVTRRGDIEKVLANPPLLPSPAVLSKLAGLARGSAVSETRLCGDDGELAEECLALCDDDGCELVARTSLLRTLKVGLYIALWFGLSTMYQIENKVRLNMLSLPWLQSAASLAVGSLFVTFLWATGIRKPPRLTREATRTYLPIAFCHSIGHIGAVVSAAFGAVSFTQIVKAAEPVFTCGLGVALLGSTVSLATALTLLPIVAGVALASVSELSFTWPAFGGGMLSNLAFASRNILSRASMDKPKGENMTPGAPRSCPRAAHAIHVSPPVHVAENLFGVLTIMSFLWALPFALAIDGPKAAATWAAASAKFAPSAMIKATVATGLYFYTYNEARTHNNDDRPQLLPPR